ncbi:MAG: MalY/PatB family protein [Myxococcota bacterium]
MASPWTGQWRNLDFRVELRSLGSASGPSLRITTSAKGTPEGPAIGRAESEFEPVEWLRFDCFDVDPHWHLNPTGHDEIHRLSDEGDPISEAFEKLDAELPQLLTRAGASSEFVSEAAGPTDDAARRAFLREAECAMRHRPLDLDELDVRQLQRRRSAKWRFHPPDVLPAWVAEMDYPIAAPIQAELHRFAQSSDAGYPLDDQDTGLPEAFRERMNLRFGWNPDPTRVELLSEVVQGMYIALEAFTEAGDGAIVQTPIYPPFLNVVADTGRRLIENPLVSNGTRLEFDLDELAKRIDAKTRILLLCNPHNPTGRVMDRGELNRLADLVIEHDLIVVTDEIHADLVYDGHQHIPFATLNPEIAARTVTLTSASKAFNIPGLRSSIAHFGSEDLQQRFNSVHSAHFRGGIGLVGIYASIAAWRWGQPWLDEVVTHLEGNRHYLREALAERIPEIKFFLPEATYLAWLDCSALELGRSPAGIFLRQGKVALSSGWRFGAAWKDHVRLNFATSRPILTELVDRMAKALGR